MRGDDERMTAMWSYVSPEARVPADDPLGPIREMVDRALDQLSPRFARLYSKIGRPSIPPERLLRGEIAQYFLAAVLAQARARDLLSDEHFSVDGTLIEAWAGQKSFQPKDQPPQGGGANFRGEQRRNDTHASSTDPDARLYRKSNGQEARLAYLGHVVMGNRNGLAVAGELTLATGTAEREAAIALVRGVRGTRHRSLTLGADKAYDTGDFVADLRREGVTPHVSQNTTHRRSAIDGRTTRHPGCAKSTQARRRIERIFGWGKTVGLMRKTRHRGRRRVGWVFKFTLAVYDLVRMRTLALQAA